MVSKLCNECGLEKPLEEFSLLKPKENWRESGNFRHSTQGHHTYCKACNAKKGRAFRSAYTAANGVGYSGSNRLNKVSADDRKLMSLIRHRFSCAKLRIKKFSQIETDLDEDYLFELMNNQERKCVLTGLPFVIEKSHLLCPSLDKIEPTKGYIKGNVQWLSWAANRAKGELDASDFVLMCKRIVEVSERATTIP